MEWVDIATDQIGFPDGDHDVPAVHSRGRHFTAAARMAARRIEGGPAAAPSLRPSGCRAPGRDRRAQSPGRALPFSSRDQAKFNAVPTGASGRDFAVGEGSAAVQAARYRAARRAAMRAAAVKCPTAAVDGGYAPMGREERFPTPRLSAGCGFRKETIAGMRRNGRGAAVSRPCEGRHGNAGLRRDS
jgi:hypothetical protein